MPNDFRVGEWVVHPSEDRLSKDGHTVHLRSKLMDLLVYLAQRPGEVISKDQLLRGVWQTEFVSESALTGAITELRQALGDDVDDPRLLETIPKRGYRLMVPVDWSAEKGSKRNSWLAVASALLVGAGLVALVVVAPSSFRSRTIPPAQPSAITRSVITVTPADRLGSTGQSQPDWLPRSTTIAIAPDGRSIVFSGVSGSRQQLFVRLLDQLAATPIPGTDGAEAPFFSPDGKWIGFWVAGVAGVPGELKKLALAGGPPMTLCQLNAWSFGAAWDSEGRIVFGRISGGLWQVPATGGIPEQLTTLDASEGEVSHRLPQVLPGGDGVLFTVTLNRFPKWSETRIALYSRRSHSYKRLIDGGADGRYVTSGHLVYVREGMLMGVPFDLFRQQVTGGPVGVLSGVMQSAYRVGSPGDTGAAQFSVAPQGTFVYVPGGVVPDDRNFVFWLDRAGQGMRLPVPTRPFTQPRVSPDGKRIAMYTAQSDQDIWIFDLVRHALTRLTTEGRNATPVWSPDGTMIVYRSSVRGPDNLFWRRSDGSGQPERLTTHSVYEIPGSWSSDGRALAFYTSSSPTSQPEIWTLPLVGNRRRTRFVEGSFAQGGADFSPDGRWLAYASRETGRWEVYVQQFPAGGAKRQISTKGGTSPVWRRDGRELFFVQPPDDARGLLRMMSVSVSTASTLQIGATRLLFQGPYESNYPARAYDVAPDGQHFVVVQRTDTPAAQINQMVLVQNWFEELKAKVPVK